MVKLIIKKGINGQYHIYLPVDLIKEKNLRKIIIIKINDFIFPENVTYSKHKTKQGVFSVTGQIGLPKLIGELFYKKDINLEVMPYDKNKS